MASINYFAQSNHFKITHPRKTAAWITDVIRREKRSLLQLNFIFCTDEELYDINKQYLNHNTYTDIITFDNSDMKAEIEGDIYISVDRVKENAIKMATSFETEMRRVMIHGVLHLIGYKDKKSTDKLIMRAKEDRYLSLYAKRG